MFDAAVAAALPKRVISTHLPSSPPKGRIVGVGTGKASAAMAKAVEDAWPGPSCRRCISGADRDSDDPGRSAGRSRDHRFWPDRAAGNTNLLKLAAV